MLLFRYFTAGLDETLGPDPVPSVFNSGLECNNFRISYIKSVVQDADSSHFKQVEMKN